MIVGIDGSRAAQSAALWGAQETVSRGGELRLIYVVKADLANPMPAEFYRVELDKGKTALAAARRHVLSSVPEVKVKTDILQGNPAGVLVAESRFASMICIGSNGIGRFSKALFGSTAETVANDAACSVAIIRTPDATQSVDFQPQFVVAPVSVFTDNSEIIRATVGRARHHRAPVLALGVYDNDLGATPCDVLEEMVNEWRQDYPDVTWYPVSTKAGLDHFLHAHAELSTMVILNSSVKHNISAIVGTIRRGPATTGQLIVFIDRTHPRAVPPAGDEAAVSTL
ncbi:MULTISPECIES: universal stress protein [unclassified Mycolicibacterium]|uniref:universal stress protein n=1 Tax=unclassified Mycolicibacterium TaxID=2636767 RepID=UPI001392078A|nr:MULTISPECIES: universal stress protein [unclassified Mycolicibacterium]